MTKFYQNHFNAENRLEIMKKKDKSKTIKKMMMYHPMLSIQFKKNLIKANTTHTTKLFKNVQIYVYIQRKKLQPSYHISLYV